MTFMFISQLCSWHWIQHPRTWHHRRNFTLAYLPWNNVGTLTSDIRHVFLVNHNIRIRWQRARVWSLESLLQLPLYAFMMCFQVVIQLTRPDHAQCYVTLVKGCYLKNSIFILQTHWKQLMVNSRCINGFLYIFIKP